MVMNGVYIVIITACFLILGYRFYGTFIAAKVLTLDQYKVPPSIRLEDGHDYVPTNKWVVFGQHFAAIAGAGPLVGPVIAAQFGYLPGMLWILFGSVFAGAVHDMVILLASVRHDGKSIAEITKEEISGLAGMSALLATLFLLIITEAGMAVVVANSLFNSPWGTFTVASTIPIAIFVGLYLKYLRPGKIQEATIIGVILVLLAVFYGSEVPGSALAPYFTFNLTQLEIILAVYGFIASVLPVWLLLAPRGYLSTYMKIGTIGALAIGIIVVAPTIRMPALTQFCAGGGPVLTGSVIPFVFITIACGAVSGFHSLISTGTTPKMLTNERQILPIGYGAMLTESFISMMALIAATSLHPNDYFAINSTQQAFAALGVHVQDLPVLAQQVGENLMHRPGGAVSLAVGMADIFNQIPGMSQFMGFWYHFCIMFEALFILTLIDAGSRVGRYLLQELIGKFSPKFKDAEWWPGIIICSIVINVSWGFLVLQGNIGVIWPLFGVSNQLLSAVTLAIGTSFIYRHGRGRYALITMIPCIFMSFITVYADYDNIFYNYIPNGKWLLIAISVIMLILDAVVMIEAVKSWIRYAKTIPQDMRTCAEIEAETKKQNEKDGIEVPAMH